MNQISLLSQDTIDKIAAGEVVERPASIVKELVENAVDAGANAVTVEIKDGGISLIRITDNGSGIPKEQVQVAFLRHATSKIRTVDDLLTSGTLGFRGEALSSIAAVCQVEMITKTAGSLTGVRYVIEGGVEKSLEEIGAPEGTTFLVRNMFYHTPARKKFLKSATTEAGYVSDLMERMALSHPGISFKFINNRDTKLHTSGNCNLRDIVYGIYGRDIAANVVKIDAENEHIKISGFIGKPVVSRGNRNYENYFVNGRYVKSAIVAKAIEDAYKPFMMSHRYPFTALMIDIDTEQVDVNVHPTKMEVRFANQAEVYDQVYQAVKDGLMERELIPEFTIDTKPVKKEATDNRTNYFSDGIQNTASKTKTNPGSTETVGTNTAKFGTSDSKTSAVKKERITYPEPFEKVRSQLLAESKSPYEIKYPHMERRTGTMRSVTGNIGHAGSVSEVPGPNLQSDSRDILKKVEIPASVSVPNPADVLKKPISDEATSVSVNTSAANPADILEDTIREQLTSEQAEPQTEKITASTAEQLPNTVQINPAKQELPDAVQIDPVKQDSFGTTQNDSPEPKAVQMELFDDRLLSRENVKQHKLIGQVFDTYWIVEFQDKMYIIDQHAAHEKVLYERFIKNWKEKKQTSQMITPPVIVTLNMQEEDLLKRHLDQFTEVGFEIEHFGGREYSIRAVPGNLYGIADRSLFLELLDGLSDVSEKASSELICEKIASMSCKAAVKGNMRMTATEADALIGELLELENPYNCPHGRPTIISMSKYELEKKFKRIV